MMHIIVQIICGLCAFMGIGQAVSNKATKFDKIAGYIVCIVFLAIILFIEEVLK